MLRLYNLRSSLRAIPRSQILIRRSYAIRDRYIFPPKQISIEEQEAEALKKEQAEINKRKQLEDLAKKNSTLQVEFEPPVQPGKPRGMTVALIGLPNAGKSTLVNRFVGSKVSAVSTKSHTTRTNTLGVVTVGSTQLVFVDTPGVLERGFQKSVRRDLGTASWDALEEADTVLVILDCVKTFDTQMTQMIDKLRRLKEEGKLPPAVLTLNKSDLVEGVPVAARHAVEDRIKKYIPDMDTLFSKTFLVSALSGNSINKLQEYLVDKAPLQDWCFSSDTKTDQSPLQRIQEIIREKIFKFMNREVPYQITVEVIGWTPKKDGSVRIDANIYLRKESQKKICYGTKGLVIASIQREATEDAQVILNQPVQLVLHVKVKKQAPTPDEEEW